MSEELDATFPGLASSAYDCTHAARQLATGRWTSKLGADVDIEHDLHALEGRVYGEVSRILKRPLVRTRG